MTLSAHMCPYGYTYRTLSLDGVLQEGPSKEVQINDDFPDEQLLAIEEIKAVPWFAYYVNYLVARVLPPDFSYQ